MNLSIRRFSASCLRRWLPLLALACGLMPAPEPCAGAVTTATVPVATESMRLPATPAQRRTMMLDLAQSGEAAYLSNKYAEAVGRYEKLADLAPSDPDVLYNLATAYARQGARGPAIWRYLQTLELTPRDHDIYDNLQVLGYQPQAVIPIPPVDWIYRSFTGNEWTATAAVALVITFGLLALSFRSPRAGLWRARLRSMMWPFIAVALFAWPFAMMHYYFEEMTWNGVVVAEQTVARTGPSENQIETFSLPPGTIVRIQERLNDGWLKVSFAGGRKGYVEQDRVRNL